VIARTLHVELVVIGGGNELPNSPRTDGVVAVTGDCNLCRAGRAGDEHRDWPRGVAVVHLVEDVFADPIRAVQHRRGSFGHVVIPSPADERVTDTPPTHTVPYETVVAPAARHPIVTHVAVVGG
jgi:hypothetical protein